MTRLMYDSVTAADIPVTAQMVAGYIDHPLYTWSAEDWARFPNAIKLRISIDGNGNVGDVLDVETGDAQPWQVPGWASRRRATGHDHIVYVNLSNWQKCIDACDAAGVPHPLWWVAHYGAGPNIPDGAIGIQYANSVLSGGHFDLSAMADHIPGVDAMDSGTATAIAYCVVGVGQRAGLQWGGPANEPDATNRIRDALMEASTNAADACQKILDEVENATLNPQPLGTDWATFKANLIAQLQKP